jgi:hypothetical protein
MSDLGVHEQALEAFKHFDPGFTLPVTGAPPTGQLALSSSLLWTVELSKPLIS